MRIMIKQLIRKPIFNIPEINWGDIPSNQGARLLWGENPIAPKEAILAIKDEAKKINFYPNPTKLSLRKQLAKYNRVSLENIILTNGSDEAIELIAKVFISEKDQVVIPIPTFPVYNSVSLMMVSEVKMILLEKDFSLNIQKLLKKVNPKTKVIWIANPNNPTGNILLSQKQIENLAKKLDCLLVIDECYFELSQVTATSLINKYPNIIVIRSFSKVFGLAGARLGYIITNKLTASYLNRLQFVNQVFSVNRFAQAAANAILKNEYRIQQLITEYSTQKQNFEKLLYQVKGIQVIPTKTTFCLLKLTGGNTTSSELKEKLQRENIYIKDCSIYQLLGSEYVYLGVPIKKYQQRVAKAIKNILEEKL